MSHKIKNVTKLRELMNQALQGKVRIVNNIRASKPNDPYEFKHLVSQSGNLKAMKTLKSHFGEEFKATRCIELSRKVSKDMFGISSLVFKDETSRLGINSFKPLGGSLVVSDLVSESEEQKSNMKKKKKKKPTITTASAGNHGVGVAFSANKFQCPCIVYLPNSVPESQANRVRAYGAEVTRVEGNYEAALKMCREEASIYGYEIVQDVSWDEYTSVPRRIWEGYATIATEIIESSEHDETLPTHVFVNTGVGGLAAGLCGLFWDVLGEKRPRFVTVEPDRADSMMQSGIAGEPVTVKHLDDDVETCQVGLDCKRPDPVAFEMLIRGTNDFVSIPDEGVPLAMDFLEHAVGLKAGESGVAGLAALMTICQDPDMRARLDLNEKSRVCVVVCEGVV